MSNELALYSDYSSASHDEIPVSHGSEEFWMTRSEPMQYVNITIPNELVTETVNALGDFGKLHVVDLSTSNEMTPHQFAYKKRTTDVADVEKKLKNFEDQMKKRQIPIQIADFNEPLGQFAELAFERNPDVVVGAAEFAAEYEQQLASNFAFERNVQVEINRRQELRLTLLESNNLIPDGASSMTGNNDQSTYDRFMQQDGSEVQRDGNNVSSYICGVIPVKNQTVFARLVYRTSRGSNAVVKFSSVPTNLDDPTTGEETAKVVFSVVTIGSQLYKRISKICPLVGATVYPVPHGQPAIISEEINRLDAELREQQSILEQTQTAINRILSSLAQQQTLAGAWGPCPLRLWQQVLFREKVVIDTLMKCEFHSALVFMGGWCPVKFLDDLHFTLNAASQGAGAKPALDRSAPPPKNAPTPPTYINGNKFTATFQGIMDTYGIPRYQEFNPGLFTIVSFPFLYGVMYGDIGHGAIILLSGIFLIAMEKTFDRLRKEKNMNEMLDMVYEGRYVVLLMGFFSIYCGIIYNDVMSIPTNVFGTNYSWNDTLKEMVWNGEVYPIGMDPSWYHMDNSLKFFNSFKMKMAVVIGVIHMTFGMFLSLYNHINFRNHVAIVFEFVPRVLFLSCTFGWMVTMIIIKWCTDWTGRESPNIIQAMIDMFLSPGSIPEGSELFSGQAGLQLVFVFIALICIPWMLCPKPLIEHGKRQGKCKWMPLHSPADDEYQALHADDASSSSDDLSLHHSLNSSDSEGDASRVSNAAAAHGDEHSIGDAMIHQSIHTIEFILGAVSNTASYLRLWALSLAHAQLSEVFWEKMIVEYGYTNNGFVTFAGTAVWAVATFAVIIAMDSLECYLHALRLHWVEWANKFFYADGIPFQPFEFKAVDE